MARRRNPWKEYHLGTSDDVRRLYSAWLSNTQSFGKGKRMVFEDTGGGGASVTTNLSLRDVAALARSACVRMPDYVTGWNPDEAAPWDKE